jgi:hypothetical protein
MWNPIRSTLKKPTERSVRTTLMKFFMQVKKKDSQNGKKSCGVGFLTAYRQGEMYGEWQEERPLKLSLCSVFFAC